MVQSAFATMLALVAALLFPADAIGWTLALANGPTWVAGRTDRTVYGRDARSSSDLTANEDLRPASLHLRKLAVSSDFG